MENQQVQTKFSLPALNDGKDFPVWWPRMKAYAAMGEFLEALGEEREATLPESESATINEETPEGQAQLKEEEGNVEFVM